MGFHDANIKQILYFCSEKQKKMSYKMRNYLILAFTALLLAACKSAEYCNCG